MVDLAGAYDVNDAPSGDYSALPAGDYTARIIDVARVEINRKEDEGDCLNFTFKIDGGDHDGRLVWHRVNLFYTGPDEKVSQRTGKPYKPGEIARAQFAAMREATGVLSPQSTDELLHIPVLLRLTVRKDLTGQYPDGNNVAAVKPIAGGGSVAPARGASPARPAAAARPAAPAARNPFAKAAAAR